VNDNAPSSIYTKQQQGCLREQDDGFELPTTHFECAFFGYSHTFFHNDTSNILWHFSILVAEIVEMFAVFILMILVLVPMICYG
jgi:hypothetical protein